MLAYGGDENRVVSGGVRRRKVDSALLYNERALLACAAQLAGWDADDVIVLGGVHVQRQQPRVQEGGKRREQRTNGSHGPQRQEEEQPEREEEEVGGGDSERAKRVRRRSENAQKPAVKAPAVKPEKRWRFWSESDDEEDDGCARPATQRPRAWRE